MFHMGWQVVRGRASQMEREDFCGALQRQARLVLVALVVTAAAALAGNALGRTSLGDVLESKSCDLRFLVRSNPALAGLGLYAPPRVDPRIVVVGLDRATYQRIPTSSLRWNPYHAAILRELAASEASAVGLDLFQDVPRDDPDSQGDRALATVLRDAEQVVLVYPVRPPGTGTHGSGTPTEPAQPASTDSGVEVFPIFRTVVTDQRLGLMNLVVDGDGVIRRHPLFRGVGRDAAGAVTSRATLAFRLLQVQQKVAVGAQSVIPGRTFRLGSLSIPWDEDFFVDINYAGPGGQEPDGRGRTFPYFSYVDLLDRARQGDHAWFRQNFAGRIVLVGESDPMINSDRKMTPYYAAHREMMPGVEIHANILNTVLTGAYLRRVSPGQALALILGVAGAVTVGVLWLPAGWALAWLVALLTFYGWATLRAFSGEALVLPMVGPQAAGLVAALTGLPLRILVLDRDSRTLESLFGRYVSPQVARLIRGNPERIKRDGEEVEATILFSDLNNFTTLSRQQKKEPKKTIRLLREYYEVMVPVAMRHEATLQSFQGDGMMILFNAPVRQPDHALRALRTAIDLFRAMYAWQQERARQGLPTFWMKIGINTGLVVAGNVGSQKRMEYSVIGDTTNVASRIMGVTSELGCDILIGQETWQQVHEHFRCGEPRTVWVKGIEDPIKVHEVAWWEGSECPPPVPPGAVWRKNRAAKHPPWRSTRFKCRPPVPQGPPDGPDLPAPTSIQL